MSDFKFVPAQKAQEVLTAASADSETADHLTKWCGVSTFPLEASQYLILAPQGATKEKLTTQDGVYVIEIVSEILLEQIKQYNGCGRPLLQELGFFLLTLENIENLDEIASFFEAVYENAQLGLYKTTLIPLPVGFFRQAFAPTVDDSDDDIPDEVMEKIIASIKNNGMVEISISSEGISVENPLHNEPSADSDGDWLFQLDETEQIGDDADFASTEEEDEEEE